MAFKTVNKKFLVLGRSPGLAKQKFVLNVTRLNKQETYRNHVLIS